MFEKIGQEWANDSFVTFTTEIEIQQREDSTSQTLCFKLLSKGSGLSKNKNDVLCT